MGHRRMCSVVAVVAAAGAAAVSSIFYSHMCAFGKTRSSGPNRGRSQGVVVVTLPVLLLPVVLPNKTDVLRRRTLCLCRDLRQNSTIYDRGIGIEFYSRRYSKKTPNELRPKTRVFRDATRWFVEIFFPRYLQMSQIIHHRKQ